jgi:taurine dioxygenase
MTHEEQRTARSGTAPSAAETDIRPLSAALGVEVHGIDLARTLPAATIATIRRAWEESCVVLFRRQHLSLVKQIRVASSFGAVGTSGIGPPPVLQVTNVPDKSPIPSILPEGAIDFHSDQSYLDEPSVATMLYALDVPASGGNTLFANGFRAYETLPQEMQQRLASARALHVYDYDSDPTRRPERVPEHAKQALHPVFRMHEPTGKLVLYVNRLMTWSILDMPPEESRQTLEFLFRHQESAAFVYEHVWQSGDVVIWDNRSCNHARTDFDPRERRRLMRITLLKEPALAGARPAR